MEVIGAGSVEVMGSVFTVTLILNIIGFASCDKELSQPIIGYAEICETNMFNPTCQKDHVILMTHARYGRMKMGGKCINKNYGSIGCGKDVLELADTRCSGRKECIIPVPESDFAKENPCPEDLKPYLEASYKCVKVHTPRHICTSGQPVTLTQTTGFIASSVTAATNCGTHSTPWLIQSKKGQTIVITLYDFTVANSNNAYSSSSYNNCNGIGTVRNYTTTVGGVTTKSKDKQICSGISRTSVVLQTKATKVELRLNYLDKSREEKRYMFKYEVVGCADPPVNPHSWMSRKGGDLTIRCNHSADQSTLKCQNGIWVGSLLNCSAGAATYNMEQDSIPFEVSILIVIIIALVIGLVVLILGLMFLKKQHSLCTSRPRHDPDMVHHDKDYMTTSYYQTSTYGPKPCANPLNGSRELLGSDMPPCTPLMGGGIPRESPYGPITADRLACGCPVYMTRDELQNQQNIHNQSFPPCSAKLQNTSLNPADILASCQINNTPSSVNNTNAAERVVIGPDMLPLSERQILFNGGSVGMGTLKSGTHKNNTSPLSKRFSHSTFKPIQQGDNKSNNSSANNNTQNNKLSSTSTMVGGANNMNNNRNNNNMSDGNNDDNSSSDNFCNTLREGRTVVVNLPLKDPSGGCSKDNNKKGGMRPLLKNSSGGSDDQSDTEAAAFMPRH